MAFIRFGSVEEGNSGQIVGESPASSSQSSELKGTFVVRSILRKYRHLYSQPATPPTNQNQAFIVTERVVNLKHFSPIVFENQSEPAV
jgi:hypothetical protein